MVRRILITGHHGYLGSVMSPLLCEAGYEVVGLDTDYYADCTLVPDQVRIPTVRKDLRDLGPEDLEGFDAVVHLAALSNDPIGNLNPGWTDDINFRASVRLAELAKAAGVSRLLFSSSCIMYGMSEASVVTEESPLDPKTDYARSKVNAEQAIARLAGDGFSPTFLRNGTIYGLSPRMRFDTVLNNLVGSAVTTGKIVVRGDGTPWRPVAHINDVARAFLHVLEAPIELVHNQAFNTGEQGMNHQIIELAEVVSDVVPGCTVECLAQPDADQRTYKTDFGKFARTFPAFRFQWSVQDGAKALYEAFKAVKLTHEEFLDRRFTRLKWLRSLLESGRLDADLRWRHQHVNEGPMATKTIARAARGTGIHGVKIIPLRQMVDERGKIMHMLKATDPHFIRFGEIYFSCAWPGTIKAWHVHKSMTLHNAVISGRAKLVLYDARPASPTKGQIQEIFLGEDQYCLVQIPPGITNGYKAYGDKLVILANCATEPYDPEEIVHLDPFTPEIPYEWGLKHG